MRKGAAHAQPSDFAFPHLQGCPIERAVITAQPVRDRSAESSWDEVVGVSTKSDVRELRLLDGRRLTLHALACVGKGDRIRRDGDGRMSVKVGGASLPVVPDFRYENLWEVAPGYLLPLKASELVSASHWAAYRALGQFHYRSHKSFGRRAVLLLQTSDPRFPSNLGFVEVTTPFLHLRNRNLLLDAPYDEPGRDVRWDAWDLATRSQLVNVIVRISRLVVHPEMRGLGLSRVLIDLATAYAQERWHVGRVRPLFLEITADMLSFMPFVIGGGMHYIGDTEGNLKRIARDMTYLSRTLDDQSERLSRTRPEDHSVLSGRGKGILRRQKRDVSLARRLRDDLSPGDSIDAFLGRILHSDDIESEHAELLLPLVRHPKPTYMKGLTPHSEAFLRRRIDVLNIERPHLGRLDGTSSGGSLNIRDLSVAFSIETGGLRDGAGGQIRRAFGLDRSFEFRTGLTGLTLRAVPGEVCYVYGASGAGKTTFLEILAGRPPQSPSTTLTGEVSMPSDARIGELRPLEGDLPLIAEIGAKNLEQAVQSLNAAGLSEPRLYLSRYGDLSAGQKYRASLAHLICSGSNVWLLDEFAAGLDDATAMAVGRNFSKASRSLGVITVIATVRRFPLVNAVAPEVVVELDQIGEPTITRDWRTWVSGGGPIA